MSTKSAELEISGAPPAWERAVHRAVSGLRYGSVEVQVHDGRVVQIETREKVRFTEEHRRPHERRRQQDEPGRAHRTPGGAEPSEEETSS